MNETDSVELIRQLRAALQDMIDAARESVEDEDADPALDMIDLLEMGEGYAHLLMDKEP